MDAKRPSPRHIIIKMPKIKDKERIFKVARKKQVVTYNRVPIRLSMDFSKETLPARRDWQEGIIKVTKSKDLQPKLLYPAKLSFRIKGQIKSFPDKKKLKEFIISKQLLYEMLKDLFKKKIKTMNNKMTINTYLSTIEAKKLCKQVEQKQNHRYGERFDGCQMGGDCGGNG